MQSSADTERLTARYVELALAGSPQAAIELVIEPLADGTLGLEVLFEHVLTPAAERIGERWYRSEITVADEHLVTQLTQRVIATAAALAGVRSSHEGRDVVLACPDGEIHDTGVRMVAALLGAHGHAVHMLGATTPTNDLVNYVEQVGATHVGLSIVTPLAVPAAIEAANALRARTSARVFIGGRAATTYTAVASAVGGEYCRTIRDALDFLAAA